MIRNYFSLVGSQLISRAISFFWVIYMARQLGVTDYGRYSTVMAIIAIATSFMDLGVPLIAIREIVKDRSQAPRYIGAQIILRLAIGLAAVVFFAFNTHWSGYSYEMKILILLASLHMLFHSVGMIGDVVFAAFNRQYLTAVMHVSHNFGWAILGFLALRSQGNLPALLVAMVVNSTVVCVVYFWLVFTKFAWPDFRVSFRFLIHLVRDALPLGLTAVFVNIFQRIDRVLVSRITGDYDVGVYSAAMTLISPITDLIWCSAIIVIYPYMAKLAKDEDRYEAVFRNILCWIIAAMFGCFLVFAAFPDKIIRLIFGQKFSQSAYVLGVLALQLIPIPVHAFFARVLLVDGKQNAYFSANLLAVLTNLLLNVLLIKKWGVLGASLSCVLTNTLLIFYYRLCSGMSVWRFVDFGKLWRVAAVGCVAIAIAVLSSKIHLFVALVVFTVIYLPLNYWTLNFKGEWKKTITAILS